MPSQSTPSPIKPTHGADVVFIGKQPRRSRRRSRRTKIGFHRYLPHIVTLSATSMGFLGIFHAINAHWPMALISIFVAAILDTLDGRVARALKTSDNQFGVELDSLSDVIAFGCSPAVIYFLWGQQDTPRLSWIAGTYFVVCIVLRLARFNTFVHKPDVSSDPRFFVGVPSPAAALLLLLPIAIAIQLDITPLETPWLSSSLIKEIALSGWCIAMATLAIAPIPTFALKGWRIIKPYNALIFAFTTLVLASLVSFPWETSIGLAFTYLLSIPLAAIGKRWITRQR